MCFTFKFLTDVLLFLLNSDWLVKRQLIAVDNKKLKEIKLASITEYQL